MARFTDDQAIRELMVARLGVVQGLIWEPCAGTGHLVDAVLNTFPSARIHLSEIDKDSVAILRAKYGSIPSVSIEQVDTVLGSPSLQIEPAGIIANPPFGAWQTQSRRSELRELFPDTYVKESYALFLHRCFERLRQGGRLVFIIPDTFLWLHRHESQRRRLLLSATWENVVVLPSKLLPSAAFGYAGLAIITIVKTSPPEDHIIQIYECASRQEINSVLVGERPATRTCRQSQAARTHKATLTSNSTSNREHWRTLGDIAEVRTGFYSGNDRRWRYRSGPDVPRSKGYQDAAAEVIHSGKLTEDEIQRGLEGERILAPMIRGGAVRWLKPTQWYCDWSCSAVDEYRRGGENPARFQNSEFYFREGIGVPMVAGKRITAALIEHRLFDQSIVGIFPGDNEDLLWLLAFLNSDDAARQIQSINPTANNSAGYLKRLRVPYLTPQDRAQLNSHVKQVLESAKIGLVDEKLEEECFGLLANLLERAEPTANAPKQNNSWSRSDMQLTLL